MKVKTWKEKDEELEAWSAEKRVVCKACTTQNEE
jgi:hypothetical protein